ncbi:tricyclene synthase EBOS, chloroplastic-like [Vigna umbellata]|uniref:tricyclene synthase EBOS, chloroplastic-like n=1 Tax=Vigna umbellata TaxID=87088 RepID=UPI001F5F1F85|nr:tricyclene synthase EBOS, chloroplastic-like [Vigna umbellata]
MEDPHHHWINHDGASKDNDGRYGERFAARENMRLNCERVKYIFERFREENGNFKENLVSDAKGMLSLYEASFLGYEGEKILDEAMVFSSFHLRVSLNEGKSSNMLLEQVNHALELPLHHRIQRLEARWYIESYAKRTDSNRLLLEAAKLDFNIVQSTLQNDLQEMSRWWRGMGLASQHSIHL